MGIPIDSLDTSSPTGKGKRKGTTDLAGDDMKPAKARTLGGDRNHTIPAVVKEIVGWSGGSGGGSAWHETKLMLPVLPLLNTTDVTYVTGKTTQWLDYVPSPVVALKATCSQFVP